MDDVARAEREGRARWAARLRRLPEVAAALVSPTPNAERRVAAALADPRAVRPTPGVELFLLDEAGLLLDSGSATCWRCRRPRRSSGARWKRRWPSANSSTPTLGPSRGPGRRPPGRWERRCSMGGARARGGRRAPTAAAEPPLRRPAATCASARSLSRGSTRSWARASSSGSRPWPTRRRPTRSWGTSRRVAPGGPPTRPACARMPAPLWIDGVRHDAAPTAEGLVPMVKHALVAEAVNRHGFALYVHGAMLRSGDSALLLPGGARERQDLPQPGAGRRRLRLAHRRDGPARGRGAAAAGRPGLLPASRSRPGPWSSRSSPSCGRGASTAAPTARPSATPGRRATRATPPWRGAGRSGGSCSRATPPAAGRVCCGSTVSKPCGASWRRRRRCGRPRRAVRPPARRLDRRHRLLRARVRRLRASNHGFARCEHPEPGIRPAPAYERAREQGQSPM